MIQFHIPNKLSFPINWKYIVLLIFAVIAWGAILFSDLLVSLFLASLLMVPIIGLLAVHNFIYPLKKEAIGITFFMMFTTFLVFTFFGIISTALGGPDGIIGAEGCKAACAATIISYLLASLCLRAFNSISLIAYFIVANISLTLTSLVLNIYALISYSFFIAGLDVSSFYPPTTKLQEISDTAKEMFQIHYDADLVRVFIFLNATLAVYLFIIKLAPALYKKFKDQHSAS